jgi:formylglycine-generating enzyme required for sulfatase activity
MSRIFLSHSSANNAEAIAIRDWMIAHGWDDVFLDLDPERGLKAGERWQEALKRAAERCEMVVFLISPVWAASKWCLAEFLLAKSLNKQVFAVIVEPTPFSELPTEMTAEWQITDLTTGARDFHATVTLPGGKTTDVALGTEGLDRLRNGLVQSGLDPKHFVWPPADDPDRSPYRGLPPLEADDAGIFFGREAAVIDALDRLRGLRETPPPRLLVILGASGSGKSSFLRAGLLPRLARNDRQFLAFPIIRPERVAISGETGLLRALEGAFRTANLSVARADLRAAIDGGATKLRALLSMLAQKATPVAADATVTPKAPTLVLSIDQAEELFLTEGQQEAQHFLSLLRDLVTADAPAVTVLFTIRSDHYERLQLVKELEGMRQQALSLPPMPRGSFAEVIKGPAQRLEGTRRALRIDDALVDALLADIDASGAKDALPLLAFTLERLYGEYGATGHLKLEHYEKLGRVAGSIEAAVERAFKAADADPKVTKDKQALLALLRRGLIPWLAGIDPDTGAPRRRVARLSEIPAEAQPLIDRLIEQRLLSSDVAAATKETTIEPAHEALLRQWGLLRGWLIEDAALLTVLDGIKRAARDWVVNGNTTSWLAHTGERLRAAERLLARPDLAANLEPTDTGYVAACRTAEQAARSRTRRIMALVGALVGLLTIAGIGWWNQDVLSDEYRWRVTMGGSALTVAKEKKLASQPKAEFAECKRGCPTMVVVPAGKFIMGSPEEPEESPQHEVTIAKPFGVGKTEVTFAEWDSCAAAGACPEKSDSGWGRGDRPVIGVSWEDAKLYVAWLSQISGKEYRLLAEAEWEYAARGGNSGRYGHSHILSVLRQKNVRMEGEQQTQVSGYLDLNRGRYVPFSEVTPGNQEGYSFRQKFSDDEASDDEAQLDQYAWFRGNSNGNTQPVGKKAANAFGLHDMHGNVWEWVEDRWHDSYEGAPTDGSPWVKDGSGLRVVRGGSWNDPPEMLVVTNRHRYTTLARNFYRGFRVARTLNP